MNDVTPRADSEQYTGPHVRVRCHKDDISGLDCKRLMREVSNQKRVDHLLLVSDQNVAQAARAAGRSALCGM
ncbi:hypothetical protein PBS_05310 [Paraburkholderia sp. 2C]